MRFFFAAYVKGQIRINESRKGVISLIDSKNFRDLKKFKNGCRKELGSEYFSDC